MKRRFRVAVQAGFCLLAGLTCSQAAFATDVPSREPVRLATLQSPRASSSIHANFAGEVASAGARRVADWVVASADNRGLSFLIVDKTNAKLFLLDPTGSVRAAAPVLLGLGRGDVSPPGIGNRKLSTMTPAERITPAGRFLAAPGENLSGEDILWVDYEAAISLHRATDVKPGLSRQDRLARLASATTLDNRVSHGCINVSVEFYDNFIRPTFRASQGIVYILPEEKSVEEVFHIPTSNRQAQLEHSNLVDGG